MVEAFECPLCLDVLETPIVLDCGNNHSFCKECIRNHTGQGQGECPVCRQSFNLGQSMSNKAITQVMSSTYTQCTGCKKTMRVSELRKHTATCSDLLEQEMRTQQQQTIQNSVVAKLPNRHTFKCPFCPEDHLDNHALIQHCNLLHKNSSQHVVCPICVSMPWGDPAIKSMHFMNHLNARHKFEYATYVDFQVNDDAMMSAAIEASKKEK